MSNLPANWRKKTLSETCNILAGFGFPERLQGKTTGDIPFFKVGDISNAWKEKSAFLTTAKHYLSIEEAKEIRARPLPKNTTVFAKIGAAIALNRRAMLSDVALVDNNVMGLHPLNEDLDYKYLFHFVCTLRLDELSRATTVPSIRKSDIEQIEIPVPPPDEQRQIVAEIEKQFTRLEAGVTALRQVQAKLKRYRAAVLKAACEGRLILTEAEKWEAGRLGDVLLNIEAGKSFKCEERPPAATEIGVVKVSAVTWGTFNELESKTCLDLSRIEARYLINPGEFLFSRANTIELIGACVIAKQVTLKVMLSDKILRFRFSDKVVPEWILYWLRSEYGRREIERLATGNQESMRNIGQDRIRQISMNFPPLAEQTRIVAEVERRLSVVEELEAVIAANLQRAARLRQSILQQAFSGRLLSETSLLIPS